LTTLTLRRDPGAAELDQYRVFDGDRYVGRIYQADKARWFWGLAYDLTAPADPPHGWHEPSREAATEKLEAPYVELRRPES
jgi:hypothetical protein